MTHKQNQNDTHKALENPNRRRALKYLGLAGASSVAIGAVSAGGIMLNRKPDFDKVKTSANIVIAGAGAAGLTTASYLATRLQGANITIIDPKEAHFYQPGFTLVAAGIKDKNYPISKTTSYIPDGINYLQEAVAEIDPDSNKVVTSTGKNIPYDYLFVATGMKLNYDAIEGMEESLIGKEGIGSIYHSPEGAYKTWLEMSKFADNGGVGVFQRPPTEMKCAGAPLKYTFITEDHLTRRNNRGKAEIIYHSNNNALFSVPIVSEKVRMLFDERDIKMHHNRILKAIDPGKKIVTFSSPEGDVELGYDFINVIPPMTANDVVMNSPLPWQTGQWASEGWMEVDRGTLRHERYPNIFGVGDIAGVPKGKTAASVKWMVPIAVDHLVAEIQGKESNLIYTGYTSCPMITRLGRAMLVEFDYENNLMPSFPGVIAPLEELWVSWVMKTMALKPTYISMLRGLA